MTQLSDMFEVRFHSAQMSSTRDGYSAGKGIDGRLDAATHTECSSTETIWWRGFYPRVSCVRTVQIFSRHTISQHQGWVRMDGVEVSVYNSAEDINIICGTINTDISVLGEGGKRFFLVSCPEGACGDQLRLEITGDGSREVCIHFWELISYDKIRTFDLLVTPHKCSISPAPLIIRSTFKLLPITSHTKTLSLRNITFNTIMIYKYITKISYK